MSKEAPEALVDGHEAIFKLQPGEYYLGMWFVGAPGMMSDWLGVAYRDANGKWHIKYRFRFYNSFDPWDKKDTKRAGYIKPKVEWTSEEAVLKEMRHIAETAQKSLRAAYLIATAGREDHDVTVDEVLVRGDQEAFGRALTGPDAPSWAFSKQEMAH